MTYENDMTDFETFWWLEKVSDNSSDCPRIRKVQPLDRGNADESKKWLKWDGDGIRLYLSKPQNWLFYNLTLLRQSCHRKCPHFPFWKITLAVVCCLSPLSAVTRNLRLQWSTWPDQVKFRTASHCMRCILSGQSLCPVGKCWERSSELGCVQRAVGHQEKTSRNSCRSAQPLWLWYLASHRSAQRGGRLWSCFCDMLTTVSSWISGHHVFICQTAERSCALYSIISAWSRASRSESWRCSCLLSNSVCLYELVVCYKSNLFMFSVVRFKLCLVSKSYLLFQSLALAREQTVTF